MVNARPFRAVSHSCRVGTLRALRLEAGVTQSPYYVRRRRQARARRIRRASAAAVVVLGLLAVVFAFVYAGSSNTIAKGVTIDGVDVGGLSSEEAVRMLEQRSTSALARPI